MSTIVIGEACMAKTKFKYLLVVLIIGMSFLFFTACEDSTLLQCATISEITSAGSENYGVQINFLNDKRLEDKFVDVQIKFSEICDITFWEENQEKLTLEIDDYDEWYSLTSLIAKAKGHEGEETFEKFADAVGKTYLFNYDGDIDITFRVVVGDVEQNSEESGQILVGSEPICDQFTLKIK